MDIETLLKDRREEREGIYVLPEEASGTVWDALAADDLLDAATSAVSESHAREKAASQIIELKRELRGGILLDVGCGYGRIAEQLLPEHPLGGYIGIDSSIAMLRFAEGRKVGRNISTPMHFVYGEIDAIPLKDNSVDAAVVSAVFLHNHKSVTKRSLRDIHRVLRPGGVLFVHESLPNRNSLMGFQATLYLSLSSFFRDPYRNGPVRFFSRREVERLMAEYREVTITSVGFSFLPKRLIFLPERLNHLYYRSIARPLDSFLKRILPHAFYPYFGTHHNVRAIKPS